MTPYKELEHQSKQNSRPSMTPHYESKLSFLLIIDNQYSKYDPEKRAQLHNKHNKHNNSFDPTKREKQYRDLLAKRTIDDEKKYNETEDDIFLLI